MEGPTISCLASTVRWLKHQNKPLERLDKSLERLDKPLES